MLYCYFKKSFEIHLSFISFERKKTNFRTANIHIICIFVFKNLENLENGYMKTLKRA